uniref:AlNc14C9G1138 protein n=1 Tax=Albugo laibachii Nc14 TaxID=890382 RepID=F0W265_9STRA|nr:AlNc14C9G1138 [Albugo laibachii Nc14]|eukprot:CCA15147.1 AlNc14C9G1138 [Albugo laibachii Nc14]
MEVFGDYACSTLHDKLVRRGYMELATEAFVDSNSTRHPSLFRKLVKPTLS